MQLSQSLLFAVMTLIPALWAQNTVGTQTDPAPTQRRAVHSRQIHGGIPGQISNRLATETGDIYLSNTEGPPNVIQLDPRSTLENLSCESDLVVMGKLGKGTSHPTEDQGYLYSDWDFTIEEVIKNTPSAPVAVGQSITVTSPGGSLTIKGRHVYAVSQTFSLLQPGEEALLYLRSLASVGTYSLNAPTGFHFSGENAIAIDKLRFAQFEGMKKNTVLSLAHEAAASPCVTGGRQ